jgi:AraC-like DNA-binding protein
MERRTASTGETPIGYYREFAPHPALAGRVRALFSFTCAEPAAPGRRMNFELTFTGEDRYTPSFADAHASVVFDLGISLHADFVWRENAARGGHLLGPMRRVTPGVRPALPAMVGAFFHPDQLAPFVKLHACEVTDRVVPMQELWGRAALDLSEQLASRDEGGRLDLLEGALLRHMDGARERGTSVKLTALAELMVRRNGAARIDDLADAAGVSRQQLTRVFRERVGVSPKLYCRMARFQGALAYTRGGESVDWARAALELGYADQSHMIAEFREFSSLTPRMLATERWLHPFMMRYASTTTRLKAFEPQRFAEVRGGTP